MKIIAILLIVGILFSYVSMLPVDTRSHNCSEKVRTDGMKLNGGFSYHCPLCPLIVNATISEPVPLPLVGRLFSITSLPTVDGLTRLIFRPPEYMINSSQYSKGMRESHLV
jgi:hypothetical protein